MFCKFIAGALSDDSKAQVRKSADIDTVFLQEIKEEPNPHRAGKGNPLIGHDILKCCLERFVLLTWNKVDGWQLDHFGAKLGQRF